MFLKKKIVVIGCGFSGIISIKSLKEEGFDPICYEKSPHAGGTWFYREDSPYGLPSIMPTTIINHSKEIGALSDFVPEKSLPNYMNHSTLFKAVFYDYGKKFDCFRHVVCNREVLKVKQAADYDTTGRWDIQVKNTETGDISNETYDGVMICVGQFTYPKMASYPGMEKYSGKILHTHSLKGVDMFRGKRVAVVGVGCSGLDAAVEISNVATKVYLSSRSGAWVCPRVGPNGLPFDFTMLRRYYAYGQNIFGHKISSWYLQSKFLNKRFDHNLYNLKPLYPILSKDPVTNDLLPTKVISGAIVVKRNIDHFTEIGVVFENESKTSEVDIVVMATGYTWKFPALDDGIIRSDGKRIDLYKCMYPAHLKHPSLVIIGFMLPLGPGFPLGEMQCRWAAQVFNGKFLPPSQRKMMRDISRRYKRNSKRYPPSDKLSVRVDYVQYLDEISSIIGAKPNLWKYLFTDPKLFWFLLFGPCVSYQYRLQGPHKWNGAKDAILTAYDRICYPLSGEELEEVKTYENSSYDKNADD